jgi:hypothetical protein
VRRCAEAPGSVLLSARPRRAAGDPDRHRRRADPDRHRLAAGAVRRARAARSGGGARLRGPAPGYRGYFRFHHGALGACGRSVGPASSSEHTGARSRPGRGPTACLLYPFEPTEHGWTLAVERSGSVDVAARSGEPRCLAAEVARSRGGLLRSFALDVEGLTALIDRLRARGAAHPEPLDSVKSRAPRFVGEPAEGERSPRSRRARLR